MVIYVQIAVSRSADSRLMHFMVRYQFPSPWKAAGPPTSCRGITSCSGARVTFCVFLSISRYIAMASPRNCPLKRMNLKHLGKIRFPILCGQVETIISSPQVGYTLISTRMREITQNTPHLSRFSRLSPSFPPCLSEAPCIALTADATANGPCNPLHGRRFSLFFRRPNLPKRVTSNVLQCCILSFSVA